MLVENEDYYINEDGRLVFSSSYLLKRGECCGNGCMNCPFNYKNVPEPTRSKLLSLRSDEEKGSDK